MSHVVGLAFRDDRVDGVVIRRQLGRPQLLASFRLSTDDEVAPALRAKLRELGVRTRRIHVGLPRRLVVAKTIELPAVAGADVRRMVGFELERHLPWPPADAIFDFVVLGETPGQPVRVLLVALDRRAVERVRQVLRDAGCVPRLVDVAIHNLALVVTGGRLAGPQGHAIVHIDGTVAELAVVRAGRLILSRYFSLPQDGAERGRVFADELTRSLSSLAADDRSALTELTVTGDDTTVPTNWPELQVQTEVRRGPVGIGDVDPTFLPALAMALREPLKGPLRTNLLPEELRPRPFPWPVAVTAGLAAITLLLGLAIPAVTAVRSERHLAALERRVAQLAADVRRVEQLASSLERARRDVETLRGFEAQSVRALPVLRELTELLPAEVWLTNVSIDAKGVELAGFATSAAQLIPLLEASPTLERVEFTSPVTRGRDREQFRLRATWERLAAAPGSASRPAAPAPRPPVPAPGGGRRS